ncbi:glycoside hydrolase family 48 protein [Nonomuraea sp. NPDC050383]|uniref:glycoside hydrolase family 48 protein n=1 Tax=Nonomuraea sp. NPDC050383 TaxID=3364362 RepID=UPI00378E44A1
MRHRLLAALAVLVLSVSTALAGAGTAMAAVACSVTYVKSWDSGGGFGANVTITNTGDPLTSWRLTYTWPGSQQVTQGWQANWSQSGQNVTATSLSYNGSQATGAQWTIGFNGSYSGTNTNPTTFAINGVTCGGSGPGPDPGQQAIQVSPAAVIVPEGSSATYGVRLATQPSANVTVTSTAGSGDADLTVTSGASLTFTSANWNTVQNVTVSAAQDSDTTNGTRPITVASTGLTSVAVTATEADDDAPQSNSYLTEFTNQYNKLKDPANGYFSPEGIPYHSVETLIVEAPDQGHETTSEAFSFWLWLEAQYGRVTGNWAPFNNAWNVMEQYIIPSAAGQPGGSSTYNPSDPADYAPEKPQPSGYPVALDTGVVAGQDPLANELQSTYGNRNIYGMHWLLDVDDVYGYGTGRGASLSECGDNTKRVTYINTFQRGPQESAWETVAHPSCETGRYGKSGAGYPPLFIQGGGANQWRYTNAPDADARAVQAAYWALTWATAQGKQSQLSTTLSKAAKMGDFLRYSFYDKYFKNPGCTSPSCTPGTGKSSSSYLLTWYYAWGGDNGGAWAWRVGSSSWHQGYQNPLAAWVLSPAGPASLRPQSPTAASDWQTSLNRQLDSYLWLQSAEGGIAGGATNSWNGSYAAPPAGTPTFYGWAYDQQPVYHDPPSNRWFGFQAWSLERVAEYYYVTGDAKAKSILDKWVPWALANTTFGAGGNYRIPNDMTWTGAPAASYSGGGVPGPNPGLHVTVVNTTNDVGVAAAYARTLAWYAAKSGSATAKAGAKNLIDGILTHKDAKGAAVSETREDYNRFDDPHNDATNTGLYIPPDYTGTMPNGDVISSGKTFLDIRSFYKQDPDWSKVQSYLNGGSAPSFTYHRFWAQADIAMAAADYGTLFPNG